MINSPVYFNTANYGKRSGIKNGKYDFTFSDNFN